MCNNGTPSFYQNFKFILKPQNRIILDNHNMKRQLTIREALENMEWERIRRNPDAPPKKEQQKIAETPATQIQQQKKDEVKKSAPVEDQTIRNLNVKFYTNVTQSVPKGDLIDNIHKKWWGNYDLLEQHHGYIQWLFPNSFKSRFNSYAYPLTPEEALVFRQKKSIAERYLKSYMMMLEFYGMKLRSKETGQIMHSRKPKSEQRFQATLLTRFHNHMRITRILSSLVMCGFGRYAKSLSQFLNNEINSPQGGLRGLQRYGVYEREWSEYREYKESENDLNILLRKTKKAQK